MKVRVFGTRKWPISTVNNELACSRPSDGNDDALVNGTRKSERERGKRERWREKRKRALPLPSPLPFNVRARAFSNSRKQLSRSLKQPKNELALNVTPAYWDLQVKVVL